MNHEWDLHAECCRLCGLSQMDYLNGAEWDTLFCPGVLPAQQVLTPVVTPCCSMPSIVYLGGFWFCETCDKPNAELNTKKFMSSSEKDRCTCGVYKIHGNNPPGHYNDCILARRR